MEAGAKPGETVVGTWNLYNLYGDRITHVTVEKTSGPNWELNLEPSAHEARYEVSGVIQTITENVAIDQKAVVLEIPENPPAGVDYVKHPNEAGFIPVNPVKIFLTIPEDARIGQDYKFVFEAKGNCFSEGSGAVIPGIATQLEFNVKPTTDFYEKLVDDSQTTEEEPREDTTQEEEETGVSRITGAVIGTNVAVGVLAITSFILIIVVLTLLVRMKRTTLKKK